MAEKGITRCIRCNGEYDEPNGRTKAHLIWFEMCVRCAGELLRGAVEKLKADKAKNTCTCAFTADPTCQALTHAR